MCVIYQVMSLHCSDHLLLPYHLWNKQSPDPGLFVLHILYPCPHASLCFSHTGFLDVSTVCRGLSCLWAFALAVPFAWSVALQISIQPSPRCIQGLCSQVPHRETYENSSSFRSVTCIPLPGYLFSQYFSLLDILTWVSLSMAHFLTST